MPFFKFSFFLLLLSSSYGLYSSSACLKEDFSINIQQKGAFWGLLPQRSLKIDKQYCVFEIQQQGLFSSQWEVDVCRKPVHIKGGKNANKVIKRLGKCTENSDTFCQQWKKIKMALEDDGLIFAKGEREDLKSDHGRTFCTHQLLTIYLEQGRILSRHGKTVKPLENSAPKETEASSHF